MKQKTIRKLIEALRDNTEYKPTDICRSPMFFLDAEAGKMIADALEKTLWVPCEERLPENGKPVLCTILRNGKLCVTQELAYIYGRWKWADDGFFSREVGMFDVPLAWMPLPKPYEPKRT